LALAGQALRIDAGLALAGQALRIDAGLALAGQARKRVCFANSPTIGFLDLRPVQNVPERETYSMDCHAPWSNPWYDPLTFARVPHSAPQ